MSLSVREITNLLAFSSQHSSALATTLDQISFFLVYPWATTISKIVAYYFIRDSHPAGKFYEFQEKFFYGPILSILFLVFFPVGVSGFVLWVLVCTVFPPKKYSYLELCPKKNELSKETNKEVFTLASANVLLANETFSRWNNNRNPSNRSKLIGRRLLQQTQKPLDNFFANMSKKDAVTACLPDVDILCIQEVWERCWASAMIDQLGLKYNHFIHDVGDYRLGSNYCLFGSGLFVASKYPILAVEFQPFEFRTHYAKFFSYGVLCLKIRIDNDKVAYVANLHGQAYQGKDAVLYNQLSEALSAVNAFRLKTKLPEDTLAFDAICGDFNFDNFSPGDAATQNHPLFNQYFDICSKRPGEDHSWTVGTELRQLRMHDSVVSTPESLRNVLIDDIARRHYVLDADVVEHTTALATIEPTKNKEGEVVAEEWGGKRRIDRILLRKDFAAEVQGYAFSSVLAGLTDHVPVALSLKIPSS